MRLNPSRDLQRAIDLRRKLSARSRTSWAATIAFGFVCAAAGLAYAAQDHSVPRISAPTRDAALEGHWRAVLAVERGAMLDYLHDYWTKGDFVRNPDPAGGPGHFILDGRGKPCPLASIIIRSGDRELVEQTARTNNNVLVANIEDGPVLAWILRSGLTKEECILIQAPSMSGDNMTKTVRPAEQRNLAMTLEQVEEKLRSNSEQSLTLAARRMAALQRARKV